MSLLRALLGILMLVAMIVAGGLFALQNTVPVPVDLLVIQLAERTLALWLLLSLSLGVLLGLGAASVMLFSQRARLAALRRQKQRLSLEVDRLRKVGLTDSE